VITPLPFAARRLLVTIGSGGVGKTTLAAAIALREARAGRKVLVCTIDPAKRLANCLGLDRFVGRETEVAIPVREGFEGSRPGGRLFAMMLDLRRSWDEVIERTARSPEQRDRIYRSPFYQQLAGALAGSQEYAAVAQLAQLAQDRDYDLIVLDTPPTVQALDFLEAPTRILDFLDNGAAKLLIAPAAAAGKVGLRLLSLSSGALMKSLNRLTGVELLQQLGEFMVELSGMYEAFKARAAEVKRLLASAETGFVLIASPQPGSVDEALAFGEILRAGELPLRAVIANRVDPMPAVESAEALTAALVGLPAELAGRVRAALGDAEALAVRDARELRRLGASRSPEAHFPKVLRIPRLEREVFDLDALDEVGTLLATAAGSERLSAA
jgi:anion-transporting  ArsA/GET3 family ATPase